MAALPKAPRAGTRSHVKAEGYVLVAMITTAGMYGVRYVLEGADEITGHKIRSLIGDGPVPPLETWVIAYGIVYFGLAVIAVGAPELASALAILLLVTDLLNNGQEVSKDLGAAKETANATTLTKQPKAKASHAG